MTESGFAAAGGILSRGNAWQGRRILHSPAGWTTVSAGAGPDPDGVSTGSSEDAAASAQPGWKRLRVVVVEDEAIIAMELEDLLASLGAEVVGNAMSADEAVQLAGSERPDCLTMDIRLQGGRDGVDAAVEIYERYGIRSVFVSAYDDAATVARAERANPLGWVSKPIRPNRLKERLRGLGWMPPGVDGSGAA